LKAVLGVVSLLLVLAIVAFVARTQLRVPVVAGAVAKPDKSANVAGDSTELQDKARDDVGRALQDGARRNEAAER
jgi:hypothetical protein